MIKLRMLLVFFSLLFCVVIVRLFFIQVIDRKDIGQYLQTGVIRAARGKIMDRNGNLLVTNQTKYRLFLEPKKIIDKEGLVLKLAHVLNVDVASIEAKIDDSKDWVSIKTNITKDIKSQLELIKDASIGFEEYPSRYYPEGSSSAHILGFVGKNDIGEDTGYFGLEGFYEKDLVGMAGLVRSEKDLFGQPIFLGTQEKIPAENGRNLISTIDISVQNIIKKHLQEGLEQYQAKEGCVIAVEPYSMEIIGLVCLPDFDPEQFYSYPGESYKNKIISDLYEPGSTFKPLIMAAAIDKKAIKETDLYNEDGPVRIGEYSINTWNNSYEGKISMTRIMEKSSNVGMVYIGEKLGNDGLYDVIKAYGFGETTDVDLQGEIFSPIKPKTQWYPIDFATATFGQGIAVTPIQMIKAFASLINDGYIMQPHIVKEIQGTKRMQKLQSTYKKQILSRRTDEIMKKMLTSTIENGETKYLKPKGYVIAGKTGTAQVAIAGHYDPSKTIASFIGFAPVNVPKFLMLVIVKEPKTSQWGSETAAPIFFDIAKELIVYYNIVPE